MLAGSPPCSPQIPNLRFFFSKRPLSVAILINSPTPSTSSVSKGSEAKILFSLYCGKKELISSREIPKVVCVNSFVPNEIKSACSAILSDLFHVAQ